MAAARPGGKKYAILVCGDPVAPVLAKHGDFESRFVRLLSSEGGEGEQWDAFRVFDGEVCADLASYDGVVVTGSKFDAHGDNPWILDLMRDLRECHRRQQRLLGVCFGHQVLARALGGEVSRAEKGWCLGANEIAFDVAAVAQSCGGRLSAALQGQSGDGAGDGGEASFRIRLHQVHQDEVVRLPEGARVVASSPECEVEAFALGTHVFCVQGHPEFSDAMVSEMIDLKAQSGLPQDTAEKGRRDLQQHSVDAATYNKWSQICKDFLKTP